MKRRLPCGWCRESQEEGVRLPLAGEGLGTPAGGGAVGVGVGGEQVDGRPGQVQGGCGSAW